MIEFKRKNGEIVKLGAGDKEESRGKASCLTGLAPVVEDETSNDCMPS